MNSLENRFYFLNDELQVISLRFYILPDEVVFFIVDFISNQSGTDVGFVLLREKSLTLIGIASNYLQLQISHRHFVLVIIDPLVLDLGPLLDRLTLFPTGIQVKLYFVDVVG